MLKGIQSVFEASVDSIAFTGPNNMDVDFNSMELSDEDEFQEANSGIVI